MDLIGILYRTGAFVFGGGHVMLPILQSQLVDSNMISYDEFLIGYSITQTVPGPLFTFAAFIGTTIDITITPWFVGIIALIAIFLPSFFLVFSVLPFWLKLRTHPDVQGLLAGVNVGLVGILLATLYQPLYKHTIISWTDFLLALIFFTLLYRYRLPAWSIVLLTGISNWLLHMINLG